MVGIISAMPLEIEKIKENLRDGSTMKTNGFVFHRGLINGHPVAIGSCGIGKVNAAIGTQIFIDKFRPSYLLHTGIAGSLTHVASHCHLIIADSITYHDVRREQMQSCFPYQACFESDRRLLQKAVAAARQLQLPHLVGQIVTGDDFIDSREKKARILSGYNALAVEMEGAAVAHTAFVNAVPFLVVRCISDFADDTTVADYKQYEQLAADRSASLVLQLLG